MKTLTLTFPHVGKEASVYRVDSITDSTDYWPGQLLEKKEVDEILIYKTSWKVIMKRNTEKQ